MMNPVFVLIKSNLDYRKLRARIYKVVKLHFCTKCGAVDLYMGVNSNLYHKFYTEKKGSTYMRSQLMNT